MISSLLHYNTPANGRQFTLAYAWFCVGETTGRTNAELERFFIDRIPVRAWSTHVFDNADVGSVYSTEKEKDQAVDARVEEKV